MTTYEDMPAGSRIWIYQSNRPFTAAQIAAIEPQLSHFATNWVRHGQLLKAWAGILYSRFIVLMIDEAALAAGGCSIDASTRLLKQIEQQYGVTLFDRLSVAWRNADAQIMVSSKPDFEQLAAQGIITPQTHVFNNLVTTKADLETNWEIPLAQSWRYQLVMG